MRKLNSLIFVATLERGRDIGRA